MAQRLTFSDSDLHHTPSSDSRYQLKERCESSISPIMSYSHFSISSDVNHNATENEGFDSDGLTIPRIIRGGCKFSNTWWFRKEFKFKNFEAAFLECRASQCHETLPAL